VTEIDQNGLNTQPEVSQSIVMTHTEALVKCFNLLTRVFYFYKGSGFRKVLFFSVFLGVHLAPFRLKNFFNGPLTWLPMSNTMDVTYMKVLESFRDRRSPVWHRYSASHPRKGCENFSSFLSDFFPELRIAIYIFIVLDVANWK